MDFKSYVDSDGALLPSSVGALKELVDSRGWQIVLAFAYHFEIERLRDSQGVWSKLMAKDNKTSAQKLMLESVFYEGRSFGIREMLTFPNAMLQEDLHMRTFSKNDGE